MKLQFFLGPRFIVIPTSSSHLGCDYTVRLPVTIGGWSMVCFTNGCWVPGTGMSHAWTTAKEWWGVPLAGYTDVESLAESMRRAARRMVWKGMRVDGQDLEEGEELLEEFGLPDRDWRAKMLGPLHALAVAGLEV